MSQCPERQHLGRYYRWYFHIMYSFHSLVLKATSPCVWNLTVRGTLVLGSGAVRPLQGGGALLQHLSSRPQWEGLARAGLLRKEAGQVADNELHLQGGGWSCQLR